MGFHEDDRIRRKNKAYNLDPVPILYPSGESDEEATVVFNIDSVDRILAASRGREDADDSSD